VIGFPRVLRDGFVPLRRNHAGVSVIGCNSHIDV
jgi:hypothetical protein